MEQQTSSKFGKESKFNLYAEYIMLNAGLYEAQTRIRLLGEIAISSDTQRTPFQLQQRAKKN